MKAIKDLRRLGYHFEVTGENIKYRYVGDGDPPEGDEINFLLNEIKANKEAAMTYLQLEAETRKALKRIKEKGFAKIWSDKLQKTVYFIDTPKDRPKIPVEGVAFTLTELRELTARRVSPEELKEIYDKRDLSIPPEPIQRSRKT